MKKFIRAQFRKKSRVYIMPTKMGGYFNGLLFLMFLLAVGYSNNLLLIFTLFLFGFNLIWLIQSHFHLYNLKFADISIESGHAHHPLKVKISWKNTPEGPLEWKFSLESLTDDFDLSSLGENSYSSQAEFYISQRGLHQWRYLKVSTDRPFGLYKTWIFHPLHLETIVFPPLLASSHIDLKSQVIGGEEETSFKGHEDFRSLAPYDQVESKKISWKHYARTGDLYIKEGYRPLTSVLDLKFDTEIFLKDNEQYLSWLATQMVESFRLGIPFSFEFGEKKYSASTDVLHLNQCLRDLALC
jgi:uncharacterized protein (DUF58 family)